jgi:tetrahydromethanopterin S-methyltransferase subunit F
LHLPGILHDAQGLNAPDFLAAGLAAFLAKGIIFGFIISTLLLG